jgi:hypothetical protein
LIFSFWLCSNSLRKANSSFWRDHFFNLDMNSRFIWDYDSKD